MHFGFALELSDTDLWNIDLLDAHLDLLDTDIPSKYLLCLHSVFKKSSRHFFKTSSKHVFKTSSRHVFKTCLQDVFSVTIFRLPRRLQATCLARCLQDVFKMSSRRPGRLKVASLKTCWKRLQDVFKTKKCLLGPYFLKKNL